MTGEEVYNYVASGHRLTRTPAMSSELYVFNGIFQLFLTNKLSYPVSRDDDFFTFIFSRLFKTHYFLQFLHFAVINFSVTITSYPSVADSTC